MAHIRTFACNVVLQKQGTGGKLKPIEANMKLFDMKVWLKGTTL